MMKKIIALILVAVLCLLLGACTQSDYTAKESQGIEGDPMLPKPVEPIVEPIVGLESIELDLSKSTPDVLSIRIKYLGENEREFHFTDIEWKVEVEIESKGKQEKIAYRGDTVIHGSDDIITLPVSYVNLNGIELDSLIIKVSVWRPKLTGLEATTPLTIPK